jgi:hypothetical protein
MLECSGLSAFMGKAGGLRTVGLRKVVKDYVRKYGLVFV